VAAGLQLRWPGGEHPLPGSNLALQKSSELLFILLYFVYFCTPPPKKNIFSHHDHGMIPSLALGGRLIQ